MITGKGESADWVERIVMNIAQSSRFQPILTHVAYCSADNRLTVGEEAHGNRLTYSACHNAPCCVVSAMQIMSYYVESMWMERSEKAELVAMQYGPCVLNTQIKGTAIQITEETEFEVWGIVTNVIHAL